MAEIPKLNVGCAKYPLEGYINIDKNPKSKADVVMDVRKGLPYSDSSVQDVVASHFLEHLTYDEAMDFLDEVHRVLIPGGYLTLVVPVLEFATIDHKTFYDKGSLDFLWSEEWRDYHNRKWHWNCIDKFFTQSNGYDIINVKLSAVK